MFLGALGGAGLGAELAEEKLQPAKGLIYHRPDKVFALLEKTQEQVLDTQ